MNLSYCSRKSLKGKFSQHGLISIYVSFSFTTNIVRKKSLVLLRCCNTKPRTEFMLLLFIYNCLFHYRFCYPEHRSWKSLQAGQETACKERADQPSICFSEHFQNCSRSERISPSDEYSLTHQTDADTASGLYFLFSTGKEGTKTGEICRFDICSRKLLHACWFCTCADDKCKGQERDAVCLTWLGMTFIQSCIFWAQSLHPLHVVSCETSHICRIQGN